MKMMMTFKDRVLIGDLFPTQSTIMCLSICKDIAEKVFIGKEELEACGFTQSPQGCQWDSSKTQDKEVEFTKIELAVLQEQVKGFDDQKRVTLELLPLCLKIKNASNE